MSDLVIIPALPPSVLGVVTPELTEPTRIEKPDGSVVTISPQQDGTFKAEAIHGVTPAYHTSGEHHTLGDALAAVERWLAEVSARIKKVL